MNDSFQFIDIIFFIMVAVFLVLRLRSVLGRRTGNEAPPPGLDRMNRSAEPSGAGDNVIDLSDRRRPVENGPGDPPEQPSGVDAGLARIRQADPDFDGRVFLHGAKGAFEIILGAFAAGDLKALRPLLSTDVLRNFQTAIDAHQRAGETLDSELVGIKAAEILEAGLDGKQAMVTVKFVTEQVNALRAANGEILDGDPSRVTEVVDIWTFSRDIRSRDPNWLLVATATPDD